MQRKNFIGTVDLTATPRIYRTNNPQHFRKVCIDFMPETVPTIASFPDLQAAVQWLITMFGQEQFDRWYPFGVADASTAPIRPVGST